MESVPDLARETPSSRQEEDVKSVKINPFCLLYRLNQDPLAFLSQLHRQHGSFVSLRCGPRPVYSIVEPELVREILVVEGQAFRKGRGLEMAKSVLGDGLLTASGELHALQRKRIQPLFSRPRLQGYAQIMVATSQEFLRDWRDGQERDVATDLAALSLEIITRILFGRSIGDRGQLVRQALTLAVDRFRVGLIPIMGLLEKLPLPSNRRFQRAVARLDRVLFELIQERRQQPAGEDMLYGLLSEGMSDQQLRDEAMTLFLAGQETTASALTWALGLLALHPQWQRQAGQQLQEVLDGRPPEFADLGQLTLCQGIWQETLRLYPPAWLIGRSCIEPVVVGGESIRVGSTIILPQWVAHRQPAYFPDPETFQPDRPTPPRFAYFPFGGGARVCIGEHFSRAEGVLILATLLQSWEFHPLQSRLPRPIPRISLLPAGGLQLLLRPRRPSR